VLYCNIKKEFAMENVEDIVQALNLKKVGDGKSKEIYSDNESIYLFYKGDVRCSNRPAVYNETIAQLRLKSSVNFFRVIAKEIDRVIPHTVVNPVTIKMKKVKPVKLEWIPRFYAAGSVVKRFDFPYGYKFTNPVLKIDYKKDEDDYLINDDLIIEKEILSASQLQTCKDIAYKTGRILFDFCKSRGTTLWDFKLELGMDDDGMIYLIDEISFDGMRLKDAITGESYSKDTYRETGDLSLVIKSYENGYKKLFID
jgi:phosphoribosylaminoimidazole-succinocarboxamide synthase